MKRILLYVCIAVLLWTLILWAWIVWMNMNPDLLALPLGVLFFGLSLRRAARTMGYERWYRFERAFSVILGLALVSASIHAAPFLIATVTGRPIASVPLFFSLLAYWFITIILALMTFVQLPWVEQWIDDGLPIF